MIITVWLHMFRVSSPALTRSPVSSMGRGVVILMLLTMFALLHRHLLPDDQLGFGL